MFTQASLPWYPFPLSPIPSANQSRTLRGHFVTHSVRVCVDVDRGAIHHRPSIYSFVSYDKCKTRKQLHTHFKFDKVYLAYMYIQY